MSSVATDSKYLPTIGMECHVQLKTKTKLFAAVNNDARQAQPNALISHICVALPGALPVLNEKAIELSTRAALALGTTPQTFSRFERKHYFYPDLPKGYQITQYEEPIIKGGSVNLMDGNRTKSISIERANLEEDAGKNLHPPGADYTLIDLNRAGTPLLEIVTAPALHSAAEAKALARELWLLMRYSGVSDGNLYHGHMRFDVNVSVSAEGAAKGTRTEVKNLNSFRSVEAAVNYEIRRQIDILEKGGQIQQETRGWDEAKQKTFLQRTKEEAEDYRYMPEPDVPPLELEDSYLEKIRSDIQLLPMEIRQKFIDMKITIQPRIVEDILDHPEFPPMIFAVLDRGTERDARRMAFLLLENASSLYDTSGAIKANRFDVGNILEISKMLSDEEISWNGAKIIFKETFLSGDEPRSIAQRLNLLHMSDESGVTKIVDQVLAENPKVVLDIKNGQTKAIAFLVGQVMQKSHGQANPTKAQEIIKKQLENL